MAHEVMPFLIEEDLPSSTYEQLVSLKLILSARATHTGSFGDDERFKKLRKSLLANASIVERLPRWLRTVRDLGDFWEFIKPQFDTYQGRREFLRDELALAMDAAEQLDINPISIAAEPNLRVFDSEHVTTAWKRAMDRRTSDPEGAISAAKALLETVCKHIISEFGESSENDDDLPSLYHRAASKLNLAPSQHTEEHFRKILGGCSVVVGTFATLRNRLGDSHGKSPKAVKPAPRHAELVVNLSGTMAIFLTQTFEAIRSSTNGTN